MVKKTQVSLINNCSLISEKDFSCAKARIYSNQIMHVYFYGGSYLDMDFINEVYAFNYSNGNHKYLNLFEFEPNVDLAPEVRTWAAAPDGNKNTIADALVISSLPHKILANFYVKFNKPVRPTKVFSTREKAIHWLLNQTKKNNN